jgi:hypothetical protein
MRPSSRHRVLDVRSTGRRIWNAPILLAVTIALVLGGCGGDDDGGEIQTGDVTKGEYIAQANEICTRFDTQLSEAASAYFQELDLGPNEQPSRDQIAQFAEAEVIPVVQDQIDELRDLEAPEGHAPQLTKIYDSAQEVIDEASENPAILGTGQPFAETDRLARDYGLTACDD